MKTNFKKTILLTAISSLLTVGATSAKAWGRDDFHHSNNPPVITGGVSGMAEGGAWAGGTGQNLQTLTRSESWTNGSVSTQNWGHKIDWSVDAGFSNFGLATNGENGPSSANSGVWGNTGITVIPPLIPHHGHHHVWR